MWNFKIVNNNNDEVYLQYTKEDYDVGLLQAITEYRHLCDTINNFGADYHLLYKANYSTLPDENGIIF
jgi:hypothetical protein